MLYDAMYGIVPSLVVTDRGKAVFTFCCHAHLSLLVYHYYHYHHHHSPPKVWECVFTDIGLCGCLCVCLSVTTITKKIVDGFVPSFMGRFLWGEGRPSSCFVTIGRGVWK